MRSDFMSSTVYQVARRRSGVKAKQLRREAVVPGVIYGGEYKDSLPVELTLAEANKLLKENTQSSIIKLGGLDKSVNVIVKEVQRNGVTYLPEHIDFQSISLREIITVTIPIHLIGEENLQHHQLLFQPNIQELVLKGPAEDLPEKIELEVGELKFEDKVFLDAIKLPEGIEVHGDKDTLLGVVISATSLSTEEDVAAEGAEESAEVPLVDEKEEK